MRGNKRDSRPACARVRRRRSPMSVRGKRLRFLLVFFLFSVPPPPPFPSSILDLISVGDWRTKEESSSLPGRRGGRGGGDPLMKCGLDSPSHSPSFSFSFPFVGTERLSLWLNGRMCRYVARTWTKPYHQMGTGLCAHHLLAAMTALDE